MGLEKFVATLTSRPLFPVLSQINQIHALPSYLIEILFNIILSTPGPSKLSLPLKFPAKSL